MLFILYQLIVIYYILFRLLRYLAACACHSRFQLHHWLAAPVPRRGSRVCKSSLPVITSHTTTPMWPDMESSSMWQMVNWVPHGPRQKHRISDESRYLDARDDPSACGYALMSANLEPSYGKYPYCLVVDLGQLKAMGVNPDRKSG